MCLLLRNFIIPGFIIHWFPLYNVILIHIPCSSDTAVVSSSVPGLFRFVGVNSRYAKLCSGDSLLVSVLMGILRRAENLGSNLMRWVIIAVEVMVN